MHTIGKFETAPKKTYVSYRRKKQFAMIGPASNSRVDLGLNVTGLDPTDRLEQLPPGKMCQFLVKLTDQSQVDDELAGWIKAAYRSAGS
jgi:predicted transport protein